MLLGPPLSPLTFADPPHAKTVWPVSRPDVALSGVTPAKGRLARPQVRMEYYLGTPYQDLVTTVPEPPEQAVDLDGDGSLERYSIADRTIRILDQDGRELWSHTVSGLPLCAPGVPVVAFTGDGGLGMTLAELETAVRLSLQVIVVVFNDAALSLIEIKQQPDGQGGAEAVRYRPVSFAAAATALGAAGAAVNTEASLAAALAAALRRPGPTVIDAAVDPACYPAVMDLTRGQAGRRSVPAINAKEHAQ
ncbi:MAG TPA: thiamine pyrophosphate-dependent enzyme [Streptosporangiaceae bacterium]|nr:thiamine pyrophosphate-dependent enzyme [Streptosporangiaceae bacterium]